HAMTLRLAAQIGYSSGADLPQPQNAVRRRFQKPHPKLKHCRRDLVGIIERAENKSTLRQSAFLARRRARRYRPAIVASEIAVRQPDYLLGEKLAMFLRHDGGVGNNVIDVVCAQRAGIAEIMHLDWRRAPRQNTKARFLRVPH